MEWYHWLLIIPFGIALAPLVWPLVIMIVVGCGFLIAGVAMFVWNLPRWILEAVNDKFRLWRAKR